MDELAHPGDYVTVQAGRIPLVVVRLRDGTLRAHQNVCRHRGAVMIEGAGNAGDRLRCFYHSWSYELDGALHRIPQPAQFPCVDRGELALRPAAVAELGGMVFASADPVASPPDDWFGDMAERLGPYRPGDLVELVHERRTVRANWKLFMENHIDGYHLWHLHGRSIKGLDHRRQQYRRAGRHWTFHEPTRDGGVSIDERRLGLPIIDHFDDTRWYGSTVHHLFPTLGVATQATFWASIHTIPVGPTETIVESRVRVMPMARARRLAVGAAVRLAGTVVDVRRRVSSITSSIASSITSSGRAGSTRPTGRAGSDVDRHPSVGDIIAEDVRAAEAVQIGLAVPGFTIGPLATDYERAITEFQRDIVDIVVDGHRP